MPTAYLLFGMLSVTTIAAAGEPWIIDTHTHFKGAEQIAHESKSVKRAPQDTLGKVVVVEDYRSVADRLGIRSTLIVEAIQQDRPEFNDWALRQAESPLVCGYVARGNLSSPQFAGNYQRYRRAGGDKPLGPPGFLPDRSGTRKPLGPPGFLPDRSGTRKPLLKGFRFRFDELQGYLNDQLGSQNLARLAADGMVVDLLVDPEHVAAIEAAARRHPELRMVVNHCMRARLKAGKIDDVWKTAVRRAARHPNVCCKLSSITNFSDTPPFTKPAPTTLAHYREVLDTCFDAFGEDRLIFGTNWGVCTHFGTVDDVVRLATEYLEPRGQRAVDKVMRENAIRVYRIDKSRLR